jgi:hypothetical protein
VAVTFAHRFGHRGHARRSREHRKVDSHGCWALPVARITYGLTSIKASKMPGLRRLIVCASALV